MLPSLEEADLVTHQLRPGSYGYIDKRLGDGRFEVQWCNDDGTKAGQPELCEGTDLVATCCPICGEPQCWCGVGR